MTFATATCSTCGRAIIWAETPQGSRIPLDARPAVVYQLVNQPGSPALRAEPLSVEQDIVVQQGLFAAEPRREQSKLYVSHFLTCPNAREHSRPKR